MALLILIPALAQAMTGKTSRRGVLHCLAAEELLAAGWLIPAEREYRRALDAQPLLGAAHFGLGKVRVRQARYDEAVAEFRAAIDALQSIDRSLGRPVATHVPAPLTADLADALDGAGRHEEAARVRALPIPAASA